MVEVIKRSGYVAIIGRPNVGKSTLLNHILGLKISITSRKPQTTRNQILGVKTVDDTQIVYVDTPGMHVKEPREINRYMNRVARAALDGVNVIVFIVEATGLVELDRWVLKLLQDQKIPVILAINKIDKLHDKSALLPFIQAMSALYPFAHIVPISAKNAVGVELLEKQIVQYIPEGQHQFPADEFTDRSDRFMAAEFIREKLMRQLGQELPYSTAVTIDIFSEDDTIIKIAATIWVEKVGQKSIVIGKDGARLKLVGTDARKEMEKYFEKKVFLQTWVKVKDNWSDDQRELQRFGYDE